MPSVGSKGKALVRAKPHEAESNLKNKWTIIILRSRFDYLTFWSFQMFCPLLFTCYSGSKANLLESLMFRRLDRSCLGAFGALNTAQPSLVRSLVRSWPWTSPGVAVILAPYGVSVRTYLLIYVLTYLLSYLAEMSKIRGSLYMRLLRRTKIKFNGCSTTPLEAPSGPTNSFLCPDRRVATGDGRLAQWERAKFVPSGRGRGKEGDGKGKGGRKGREGMEGEGRLASHVPHYF